MISSRAGEMLLFGYGGGDERGGRKRMKQEKAQRVETLEGGKGHAGSTHIRTPRVLLTRCLIGLN